jgi:hypothetical protein
VTWLSENSYFYSVAFNTVWLHSKTLLTAHAKEQAVDYAIATKSQSKYDVELAAALVERMRRFCEEKGIRFIVVDIPEAPAPYQFRSSVQFPTQGLELVSSETLLKPFEGAAEFHLPHGHHHITEFTHLLIGAELGRRILEKSNLEKQ